MTWDYDIEPTHEAIDAWYRSQQRDLNERWGWFDRGQLPNEPNPHPDWVAEFETLLDAARAMSDELHNSVHSFVDKIRDEIDAVGIVWL